METTVLTTDTLSLPQGNPKDSMSLPKSNPKDSISLPQGNPRDSMKSTWRLDRSQWTIYHWLLENLGVTHLDLGREVPVHAKSDPVPFLPEWRTNLWVVVHAAIPLAIHQAYVSFSGRNLGPIAAFVFYSLAFKLIAIREMHIIRGLGHRYGFFDGDKHERDGVPDVGVVKVFYSVFTTSILRPLMFVFLTYHSNLTPASINWAWLPLEVGLYGIILDFWFYWYHRIMHDFDSLWKYHRTHHLTKHPNPLLTLYADEEQEVFDMLGIPLFTFITMRLMGLPMGFYEWWVCSQFVVFAEVAGHSGLRIHSVPPSTLTWLLRYFNAELVIEDHDLHHRKGWRKSHNYGKNTRLWDRIFGTCHDRIEDLKENIDYVNTASIPFW